MTNFFGGGSRRPTRNGGVWGAQRRLDVGDDRRGIPHFADFVRDENFFELVERRNPRAQAEAYATVRNDGVLLVRGG
jgi:hypothetical protein